MRKYHRALHIFRRDLRLEDNTALLYALQNAKEVMACFIFDERQLQDNPYRSDNAVQFMVESLSDLQKKIQSRDGRLYFFHGRAENVIASVLTNTPIDLVTINRDYTPFAIKRDEQIEKECIKNDISFFSFSDALLTEPESVEKEDGGPYVIFTPFMKKARGAAVPVPKKNNFKNFFSGKIGYDARDDLLARFLKKRNAHIFVSGGRDPGRELIRRISKLTSYERERDIPSHEHTTHLSAHHKFGTISIRETYHAVKRSHSHTHALITQLYWRDFFTHIGYHFPRVYEGAFYKKYNALAWKDDRGLFKKWCEGKTGFPIVDAGMRQLNQTGYMHNRARMITASFLVKDLFINWQWGERYFAQKLVDYDPAVNNGSWQWAASTGCDAQPYFRIFNPWLQQKKFDPDCQYIKKWVPELSSLTSKQIHDLEKNALKNNDIKYYQPMVTHTHAANYAKKQYQIL